MATVPKKKNSFAAMSYSSQRMPTVHATKLVKVQRWAKAAKERNSLLENELQKIDVWLFHPHETVKNYWDVLMMLALLYYMISLPYVISFEVDVGLSHPYTIVGLILDFFFFLDVMFTFNTAQIVKDENMKEVLLTDRKKIRHAYVYSRFFVLDVVTCIPFQLVTTMLEDEQSSLGTIPKLLRLSKSIKIAKILNVVKLAKAARLLKMFKLYDQFIKWKEEHEKHMSMGWQLLKFMVIMFLTSHAAACVLMWITMHHRQAGESDEALSEFSWHPDSWIASWDVQSRSEAYLLTLYWAFTTLTTVGYGDITATLPLEIGWFIVVMIVGTSMFGFIIGNMASIMTYTDQTQVLIDQKMESVEAYLHYRKFPFGLRQRINQHYKSSWQRDQVYDENEIMAELPPTLRIEAALFVHRETIRKVPFLRNLNEDATPILVTKLVPLFASPREIIVKEGYFGAEMYFVLNGKLKVYFNGEVLFVADSTQKGGKRGRRAPSPAAAAAAALAHRRQRRMEVLYDKLSDGNYFADYCLLTDQAKHPASVKSLAGCELFSLDKAAFAQIVDQFPEVYTQMVAQGVPRFRALMEGVQARTAWATSAYVKGMALDVIEGEDVEAAEQACGLDFNLENPVGLADRWRRRASLRRKIARRDAERAGRVQKIREERLRLEGKEVTPPPSSRRLAARMSRMASARGGGLRGSGGGGDVQKTPSRRRLLGPSSIAATNSKANEEEGKKTFAPASYVNSVHQSLTRGISKFVHTARSDQEHSEELKEPNSPFNKSGESAKVAAAPGGGISLGVAGGISIPMLRRIKKWKNRAVLNCALNNMRVKQQIHMQKIKQRYALQPQLPGPESSWGPYFPPGGGFSASTMPPGFTPSNRSSLAPGGFWEGFPSPTARRSLARAASTGVVSQRGSVAAAVGGAGPGPPPGMGSPRPTPRPPTAAAAAAAAGSRAITQNSRKLEDVERRLSALAAAVAEATAAARRAAEGAEAAAKGQRAMQQAILKLAEGQGNPPGLLFSPGSNDPEVDLTARRLGVQKVRLREVSNDSAISDIDLIEETRRYGDASKTC